MNTTQKWLAEQEVKRIEHEAQTKPAYFNTFDEYVAQFPQAEHWRRMVNNKILVATYEGQSCLEGDYYIAYILNTTHYKTKEPIIEIVVNNGDDGYVRKTCQSLTEAQQELDNLKLLAPFHYSSLLEFGYRWD